MARPSKGPRLYLKKYASGKCFWIIRDGLRELGTGCVEHDAAGANIALHNYLNPALKKATRKAKRYNKAGVIYFLEAKDLSLIKIGFSTDLNKRLADLKTALPVRLVLLDTIAGTLQQEFEIHERLAAHRKMGEWFDSVAVLELLTQLKNVA